MSDISVRGLAPSEERQWEEFVINSPQTSFFHRLPWRQIVERQLGQKSHYRVAWRGDRLVGILPLTEIRSRLFRHSLVSPGYGIYAGIAAEDDQATQILADDAAILGKSLGIDYVELRHEIAQQIDWVTPESRFFVFRRKLSSSEEENMKAIPRKKRADLRKALANSTLHVEHGRDFESFFKLYAVSLRNLGTPILPRAYYASIVRHFESDVEISVVYGPKSPIAAVMSFYWHDAVLPYFGGATPEARATHAYDLLYWSVMCRAIERGAHVFDFGRSRGGGSAFDYKTHWGFSPTPLYYQYYLGEDSNVPHLGPDNPKFGTMIKMWKRLPVPIANTIGPIIARQIG